MTIVTCSEIGCRYNGYGECQLGIVANVLRSGAVNQERCPYFDGAVDGSVEGDDVRELVDRA